jgi:hypothetical protein
MANTKQLLKYFHTLSFVGTSFIGVNFKVTFLYKFWVCCCATNFYRRPGKNSKPILLGLHIVSLSQFPDKLIVYKVWYYKMKIHDYQRSDMISFFPTSYKNIKWQDKDNLIGNLYWHRQGACWARDSRSALVRLVPNGTEYKTVVSFGSLFIVVTKGSILDPCYVSWMLALPGFRIGLDYRIAGTTQTGYPCYWQIYLKIF